MITDIAIIGAGPGGITAALFLARNNIPCTLIDRSIFPRDKICGDALSGKVVSVLNELDNEIIHEFSRAPYQLPSWGILFKTPGNKSLKIPFKQVHSDFPGVPGFTAKRNDFDYFLFKKARKEKNIKILDNTTITEIEKDHGKVLLSDSKGNIILETKIVIFASGAQTRFPGFHNDMGSSSKAAGVRAYYSGVRGLDKENYVELHFMKKLVPGYFWIFPLPGNQVNAGVVLRSDLVKKRNIKLKSVFNEIISKDENISKRFKNAKQESPIKGFSLPLAATQRKLSGEGFMLTGDAGALIDPFTGEGIGNAMISGKLAALQSIECLKKNDFSSEMMKNYDLMVNNELEKEFQISRSLQKLVRIPYIFDFLAGKANKNQRLQSLISTMFEDMEARKSLKDPVFYLRMLFNL